MITVGILTVSDRSARGLRTDASGPALRILIEQKGWRVAACALVPDELRDIQRVLLEWCDQKRLSLVLTTGGTGISPRDVTPEATRGLLDKELPGICEIMRREGAKQTPMAVLSRAAAGVRAQSLVINLPGNLQGAEESLKSIWGIIPHAIAITRGEDHSVVVTKT